MTRSLFKITPLSPEGALDLVKEVFPDDKVAQETIRVRVEWDKIRGEYRMLRKEMKAAEAKQVLSEKYNYSTDSIHTIVCRK